MTKIDLDSYFQRIDYQGSIEPNLETLRALHLAHMMTFPFENLESWNKRPVPLGIGEIEEKFVRRGRGGYCFEGNTLFAEVLRHLGYEVTPLIARVRWMQPPDVASPRTHMLLKVDVAGTPWIADVGFGAVGQTVPLRLEPGVVQPTTHETRRYQFSDGVFTHQIQVGEDGWEDVYSFDLHEAVPMDFEVANWFVSTHPESLFRKTLLVTLPREDHRLILAFGEFTRRHLDGRVEKRQVLDDGDLRDVLIREFGLPAEDPLVSGATLNFPEIGKSEN
jgi:N-hydroxyarylamine O-acetyltransferase